MRLRAIHINGTAWNYKIATGVVEIFTPTGRKLNVGFCDVTGISPAEMYGPRWAFNRHRKHGPFYFEVEVKPGMIKAWIGSHPEEVHKAPLMHVARKSRPSRQFRHSR